MTKVRKKRRRVAEDPDPLSGESHGGESGSEAGDNADRQQDQGTSWDKRIYNTIEPACQLHPQKLGRQKA